MSTTSRSVWQQSFQVTKSTREITSLLNVGGGMLNLLYIVSVIQNLCGNTNRLFDLFVFEDFAIMTLRYVLLLVKLSDCEFRINTKFTI